MRVDVITDSFGSLPDILSVQSDCLIFGGALSLPYLTYFGFGDFVVHFVKLEPSRYFPFSTIPRHVVDLLVQHSLHLLCEGVGASPCLSFNGFLLCSFCLDSIKSNQSCQFSNLPSLHLELPCPQVDVFGGQSHGDNPLNHPCCFFIKHFNIQHFACFFPRPSS